MRVTGQFTVERYINVGDNEALEQHGKKWYFLATPTGGNDVNEQTIKNSWMEAGNNSVKGYGIMLSGPEDINPGGWDKYTALPSIKQYDAVNDKWIGALSSSVPLYNPKGWMTFIRGDRSVTEVDDAANNTVLRSKGTLTTGEVTLSVPTGIEAAYETLGNPYASAVDLREVDWHILNPTIYIWNPNFSGEYALGAYQSFTPDGEGNFISIPSGKIKNILQSGEAIFVQTVDEPGKQIVFKESDKVADATTYREFLRPGLFSKNTTSKISTDLYRVGGSLIDGTLQFFGKEFSNEINADDGRKMLNSGINLSIISQDKLLTVERRQPVNATDTVRFNLTGLNDGRYGFTFKLTNMEAPGLQGWLQDAYSGQQTPLELDGKTEVGFEVTGEKASRAADRFSIVFRASPADVKFDVSAVEDHRNVDIRWSVDDEAGIEKYIVMASTDGVHFTDISESEAAGSGNYNAMDTRPADGDNQYRIRAVNIFGFESYSDIAKVFVGSREPSIAVFPNPVRNSAITLQFKNQQAGRYNVRLINADGKVLMIREITHTGGNHSEKIPWSQQWSRGQYTLQVTAPDGSGDEIKIVY